MRCPGLDVSAWSTDVASTVRAGGSCSHHPILPSILLSLPRLNLPGDPLLRRVIPPRTPYLPPDDGPAAVPSPAVHAPRKQHRHHAYYLIIFVPTLRSDESTQRVPSIHQQAAEAIFCILDITTTGVHSSRPPHQDPRGGARSRTRCSARYRHRRTLCLDDNDITSRARRAYAPALSPTTMLAPARTLTPSLRLSRQVLRPLGRTPPCCVCRRHLSSFRPLETSRRTPDFNSGFTGSYDPTLETGRGPMFNKTNFGVPQFYPRDLKKRVDEYVVGQDRAKKTICATLFNHYQNLRRRHQHEHEDRNVQEKLMRQRFARDRELHQRRRDTHPVEGQPATFRSAHRGAADEVSQDEFPGHHESVRPLYDVNPAFEDDPLDHLYTPEDTSKPEHVKIDKSNLLLIGPTGVGKTYILE